MLLLQLVLLITLGICVWWIMITLLGLTKNDWHPTATKKLTYQNFGVIICAHNEETVIDRILRSLAQQDYPLDHYHTFVLADHCTDKTASRAHWHNNVTVYERTDGPRTGKGAILEWGINRILSSYPKQYDAFVIFDADNIMKPNYLSVLNEALDDKTAVVTGQRLAQNPFDSLISQWYTIYWGMLNNLCNTPRSRLGLSSMLSGTGFAFKISALNNRSWQTKTFIEDVEFDIQQTLKGNTVQYVKDAIFYDEQPTNFSQMFKQLSRWSTGGTQMPKLYMGQWLRTFWHCPDAQMVDNLFFINMGTTVCLSLLANCLINIFYLVRGNWLLLGNSIFCMVILTMLTILIGFIASLHVRWPLHKLLPGIFTYPVFSMIFSCISAYSLLKPQKEWKKIEHGQTSVELKSLC